MTLQAAEFCKENGVILYCLLPNATHILQPCDVGLFSTMKKTWGSAVKNWQMNHIGEILTKKCFPEVFRQVWYAVTTLENAVHGFRRCGLFTFTPKGVDTTKLGPSKLTAEAAEDKQQTEVPPRATTSAESIPPAVTPGSTDNALDDLKQPLPPVVPSTSTDPTQAVSETTGTTSSVAPSQPKESSRAIPPTPASPVSRSQSTESAAAPPQTELQTPTSPADHSASEESSVPQTPTGCAPAIPVTSSPAVLLPSPESALAGMQTSDHHANGSTCPDNSSVGKLSSNAQPPNVAPSGASIDGVSPGTCFPTPTSRAPLQVVMFRDNNYVSKAFENLQVPEIKQKKVVNRLREKLPKAISGSAAIKMLREREEKKKAEEKAKRKEESEQKKKEREELKEKKRVEREEKKMKTDSQMKKTKCAKKGQKRKKLSHQMRTRKTSHIMIQMTV